MIKDILYQWLKDCKQLLWMDIGCGGGGFE